MPRLVDSNGDLPIPPNTTSWNDEVIEATEMDEYFLIEYFFRSINHWDFEATTLQFHDQAPQLRHSSLANHGTENDIYLLVDLLEMEFAGSGHMEIDGNEDIFRTILESMDTYVATTIPASKSAIKELEKVRIESVEAAKHAGSCVICMEDFGAGVEATRLPCLHLYHGHFVVPWLEINRQCPLCRFPMPQ